MKRAFLMLMAAMLIASPAMAISHFKKIWGETYVPSDGDVDPDFKKATRKAGCYVCHVKGKKKDEEGGINEYGLALQKLLDAENYDKDRIKAEPEKVKEEIVAAFKKVADVKSKDGKTFGEKIKNNELPATDANL